MVDWLNEFAEKQGQKTKKMTKKASSNRIIVDKSKFAKATNNQIVSYKGASYKVVDASYSDNKGKGVLLERCADLVGDPMDVSMGTAEDYVIGNNDFGEQEYARVDPDIQDPDPQAVEVAKFTEEATQTEEEIAQEDSIDGTSGATKPNRILMKLVEKYQEYLPQETSIVEEINTEEATEEVTEESDDYIVDEFTQDDFDGLFDDTEEVVEEPEFEEPEFIDDEEYDGEIEDSIIEDSSIEDEEVEDFEIEDDRDEEIEKPDTELEASKKVKRNRIARKVR